MNLKKANHILKTFRILKIQYIYFELLFIFSRLTDIILTLIVVNGINIIEINPLYSMLNYGYTDLFIFLNLTYTLFFILFVRLVNYSTKQRYSYIIKYIYLWCSILSILIAIRSLTLIL